jgi:hypothetical protein
MLMDGKLCYGNFEMNRKKKLFRGEIPPVTSASVPRRKSKSETKTSTIETKVINANILGHAEHHAASQQLCDEEEKSFAQSDGGELRIDFARRHGGR